MFYLGVTTSAQAHRIHLPKSRAHGKQNLLLGLNNSSLQLWHLRIDSPTIAI